jgi:hypothetical protein
MKTKTRCSRPAFIVNTRWLAYSTAAAATALAGSQSAEASIHYSGRLDVPFPRHENTVKTFLLDQPGDVISFERAETGAAFFQGTDIAYFRIFGIAQRTYAASFRGHRSFTAAYRHYVSKLPFGSNVSGGFFTVQPYHPSHGGILASGHGFTQEWLGRGTGFVGFRFDNGAGFQYGWARIKISGLPENAFKVLDYAYADPGEPIRTGQISSDEKAPEEGSTDENAPDEGSLGGLALGAVGLMAWRKSRSRTARYPRPSLPV